jgi:hypothetical protein
VNLCHVNGIRETLTRILASLAVAILDILISLALGCVVKPRKDVDDDIWQIDCPPLGFRAQGGLPRRHLLAR